MAQRAPPKAASDSSRQHAERREALIAEAVASFKRDATVSGVTLLLPTEGGTEILYIPRPPEPGAAS
jgi:hypothetical protein